MSNPSTIAVGDRVCYSRKFCQSTGQLTGEIPHARGVVTAIMPLGQTILAEIDWQHSDIPRRVNVANLSRITATRGIEESV